MTMSDETKKLVAIILAAGAVIVALIGTFVEPARIYAVDTVKLLLGGLQGVFQ